MGDRGFILESSHRIENGRTVIWIVGRLENGRSVLIRDDRMKPHFWIAASDSPKLRNVPVVKTGECSLHEVEVVRVDAETPADLQRLRRECEAVGVLTFEADLRTAVSYLIRQGVCATFRVEGPYHPGERVDRIYDNPTLHPASYIPSLRVVSFDIETDPRAQRLLSIALTDGERSRVFLITGPGQECPEGAIAVHDERELLSRFEVAVREFDPDVVTGWNIVEFDLPVLRRVADRLGATLELGRSHGPPRASNNGQHIAITGRVVLDGIRLLRGAFVRMESYALDAVARAVVGEGKTVSGKHRAAEILEMFENDRERFVAYNLRDAELVLEILDKLRLIELTVERSRLTGMTPDRVTSSTGAFDFLYLSELRRRGVVAPTRGDHLEEDTGTIGAHVFEPIVGLHTNILVFDFKSLYPSIIRTFEIDPLGWVQSPKDGEDLIVAPNGAAFRRQPGVLPGILDTLFPRREEAKRANNAVASQAIKILMNSFYGVLGSPGCRFHSSAVSNAITSFGRTLLLWSKEWFESRGHRVLYGDTDSVFVEAGTDDADQATALGVALVASANEALIEYVRDQWDVDSQLELELEKLYLRLHLPHMRHRAEGARKRYVGLLEDDGATRVDFVGVEAVRRDWTDLARELQREIYDALFADRPVVEYLRRIVGEIRAGQRDAQLVYRKALRKRPEEYVSTTPPHVAAARKMSGKLPRVIEYFMTVHGPEPLSAVVHRMDYDHYIEKQIRPIAEPVLELLGLDFSAIAGGGQQLELF